MPSPALRRASSAAAAAARLLLLPSTRTTPSCARLLAAAGLAPLKQQGSFSTGTADATAGMAAGTESKGSTQPPAPAVGGGVSERILPHLLNIYRYRSCATARDFEAIYAPHATFEDPLMRAHGVKQIKSAFYTLPKVFGESKIVEYTVQEKPTGPGKSQILIDNKQHYKVFGKAVDIASLITLDVEDGKGRQAPGLVGQEASEEQGDGGLPVGGAGGGGEPPGSHAAHPRPHGLRQGPHPVIL